MPDVVVAPFSNSDIRDWPAGHYAELIGHLLAWPDFDGRVRVVGAPTQRLRAREVVRRHDPRRVVNDCGRLAWAEVVEQVRAAGCVVANNSGVAHLAAHLRTPTVCVFSGAHERTEWRPIGEGVVLVSRAIGCAPCHLHKAADCPYGLACLREIEPAQVAGAVFDLLARGA